MGCIVAALLPAAGARAAGFDIEFGTGPVPGGFLLRGSATPDAARSALRLTEAAGGQSGSVFFERPVSTEALTVRFTVSIGGGSGADGLAFAVASGEGSPPLAGGGGSLGLGGLPGPLLILEVDTWDNGVPDARTPGDRGGDNHVALRASPGPWDRSSDVVWAAPFPLDDGEPLELELFTRQFDGDGGPRLEAIVFAASEAHDFERSPILHAELPGSAVFEGYAGWVAATGGADDRHLLHRASLAETSSAAEFPEPEGHLRELLFDHYPDLSRLDPGDTVFVVRTDRVPGAEEILASTLAGIVGRVKPRIWLQGGAFDWLPRLGQFGVRVDDRHASDAVALLGRFRDAVNGYVLYRDGDDSINVATSLAGPLGAVAVEESLETRVAALGLTRRMDVRGRDEAWLLDHHAARFSRDILVQQREDKRQLRDLATLWNALVFYDGNGPLRDRAYDLAGPDSPVFGWGEGGEDRFVGAASERSLYTIPSDWAWNVGVHSSIRLDEPLRQPARLESVPDRGPRAHFVTFVLSDGDNLQWLLNDFQTGSRWYGSPRRGTFSMGWSVAPHLARLAPLVMERLYERAARGVDAADYFVGGVSGGGYLYPSRYDHLATHARRLDGYLAASDLDIVSVLELERGTFDAEHLDPYTRQPRVRGVLYVDYGRYAWYRGRMVWSHGKPAVSARFSLWEGQDDPAEIASAIASLSFDPRSPEAYSFVNVHPWSRGLDEVKQTIDRLPPDAVVVTPDEFFAQIQRHLGDAPTARVWTPGLEEDAPIVVATGAELELDGGFSTDPNRDLIRHDWDLDGDGTVDATGVRVSAVWDREGTYEVTLRASDSGGRGDEASIQVVVEGSIEPSFRRADSNGDGSADISDAIQTLRVLFLGEGDLACEDASDANDDGAVDISDAIHTLGVLFLGEGSIPAPGPDACGRDATADALSCRQFSACP